MAEYKDVAQLDGYASTVDVQITGESGTFEFNSDISVAPLSIDLLLDGGASLSIENDEMRVTFGGFGNPNELREFGQWFIEQANEWEVFEEYKNEFHSSHDLENMSMDEYEDMFDFPSENWGKY